MRLVIQRVSSAQVSTVESGVLGAIGKGLCVLVGIGHGDGDKEIAWAVKHLPTVKFWPNESGQQWKVDVNVGGHSILLVSQFTLYGKVYKKGKLDFHNALPPAEAREVYDKLVRELTGVMGPERTQTGEFGAMMEVTIINDGPVTTIMDSPESAPAPVATTAAVSAKEVEA